MTIETPADGNTGVLVPVQLLRAVAATMVVVSHAILFVQRSLGQPDSESVAALGTLGVAAFFIISGFIMHYTCRRKWNGRPAESKSFIQRRLHRIVPLYWLVTTAALILILIATSDDAGGPVDAMNVLKSYLFVPYGFDGLKFRPILGVGWTLDFEMFFYALFAAALLLPKTRGIVALLSTLALLIVAGQFRIFGNSALGALAQPILGLFGAGIVLSAIHESGRLRMKRTAALSLALLACVTLPVTLPYMAAKSQLEFQPLLWTAALTLAICAIFVAVKSADTPLLRFGLLLGDASYLLYLSHPLVVTVVEQTGKRAGLTSPVELVFTGIVIVAASLALALAGHLLVERPLNSITAPLFGRRRPRLIAEAS